MGQVRALVALRWRMVRKRNVRLGLLGLASLLPLMMAEAVVAGQSLPPGSRLFDILLLAPTAFLLFAALALAAPLVAGGGNELFPEDQLVAYPIRPGTVFRSGLLVAPLNLAWAMQVVLLFGVTSIVSRRGPGVLLALVTTSTYIVLVTVLGQAVSWVVIGVRQSRRGRAAVRALGAALLAAVLVLLATGTTTALLDRAPTQQVVLGAVRGSAGAYDSWAVVTGALALFTWFGFRAGTASCAWALRRTTPAGRPELAPVVRRAARRTVLAELVAVDQASVWRSTALRRGLIVLAVLPGGVAMLADPTWSSLPLLPGLVAAGTGLLFGVNAFALDGAGAVWVATLPHPPRTTFEAKLVVVGETCLAAVVLAVGLAATQTGQRPSVAEALALVGSVLGSTLLVVAICGRLSLTRPHKADLRGPRDTPAPPATMAVYSLRLALATTWGGLLFVATAASGSWQAASAAMIAVVALAVRSLVRTLREWSDPVRRAHVVTTVAYG